MIANSQNIENIAIPLPITSETREIAHNFAAQQATQQKAEQVLYNTMAVLIVHSYLEMLGIATDLLKSDSWNRVMRVCDDVADLDVVNLGKLECRPLKSTDASCHIPMEVWDLRLGYVAVRIDDSLKQAALLGFVPRVVKEELNITDLKPLEALIDRLNDLKIEAAHSSAIELGQWLNNIFTSSWVTVASLLNPEQLTPAWGFRNAESPPNGLSETKEKRHSIQRAKLVDLGIYLGDHQVVLLVEITPEDSGSIGVILQVHPSPNNTYLPETLILKVIESSGGVFMQAQARSKDNFIQLQFSGQLQELFTVQIVLNDAILTEHFQI